MAGLIGMVLETALILNYQVKSGVLYQDLGLLLALFMAGLALGALMVHRAPASAPIPGRGVGAALLIALAALGFLSGARISRGVVGGLLSSGVHLILAGLVVGAVFAFASLYRVKDQRAAVSPLYAADVLGGCIGSLVATLVLVPLLGLPASALLMALLALACLLLL
jgi:spermidine synthase